MSPSSSPALLLERATVIEVLDVATSPEAALGGEDVALHDGPNVR